MLVMTLKRNALLNINDGEQLIMVKELSEQNLSLKVMDRNENGTYKDNGIHIVHKDNPLDLDSGLTISYLRGVGNQMKLGFTGTASVLRCPKKFVYHIEKPNRFDDDFFNFDTEGY